MKITVHLAGIILLGGLLSTALAENAPLPPELGGRATITSGYLDYYAADEGASEAAGDAPAAGGTCTTCEESCESCCEGAGDCCGSCGYCAPDPWRLPQPCFMQRMGITMGGWLDQGATFNAVNPVSGLNGPVRTNDWDDEYQMNQLWLYFDRPANTGGYGFALGGHIDLMYGTDWRFYINEGLEDRINSLGNDYGLAIPQAYVEVAFNRLSVKMGQFAGILDYEVVPAIANPFYSHSLCYAFTVPQLVTGVLADYKVSQRLSFLGGFHRGWMKWEDNNDDLDVMSGVKLSTYDQRSSIAYAISSGPQDDAGVQDRFVHSLVVKHQFTDRLQYILVHNLGNEDDSGPGGTDAEWYGVNQYFLYKINPRWTAGMRFEWLRDDDGVIVRGPPAALGIHGWPGFGYAGDFYEVTCGLSWRPHPNLLIRPELRWDWYDGLAGTPALPYDDGNRDDQFTAAFDAIITF